MPIDLPNSPIVQENTYPYLQVLTTPSVVQFYNPVPTGLTLIGNKPDSYIVLDFSTDHPTVTIHNMTVDEAAKVFWNQVAIVSNHRPLFPEMTTENTNK